MIMSRNAFQFESEDGVTVELNLSNVLVEDNPLADLQVSVARSSQTDWDELETYTCWKEQTIDRFGAGSPAPYILRSQRLYDGDNHNDYCEVWVG